MIALILATDQMACRVVIACKTGLLGCGLQNLLQQAGGFEVVGLLGADEDLASVIRTQSPDAIIFESGALTPENSKAVLDAACVRPTLSVLNVSLDATQPTLWRGLSVVAEGNETVVDALRRHLTRPPEPRGPP
jgi:DNA-binding NarL/FixJ family response regulator